jgi:rubrerythrin
MRAVGAVGRRILAEAVELERLAFEDYRKLASTIQDAKLRQTLLEIADEEEAHQRLLVATDRATMQAVAPAGALAELPEQAGLAHHVADSDLPALEHAIEHELGMAAFYRQLARVAVVTSLRAACISMAAAEESHAERLRAFLA